MSGRRWTTGDARADRFVILLLMAVSIPKALLVIAFANYPMTWWPKLPMPLSGAIQHLDTLAGWLAVALPWLALGGPPTLIPILLGLAALCRVLPRRIVILTLIVVTLLQSVPSSINYVWNRMHQPSAGASPALLVLELPYVLAPLTPAILAAGLLVLLLRRRHSPGESTTLPCALPGSPEAEPLVLRTTITMTRLALATSAAALLLIYAGLPQFLSRLFEYGPKGLANLSTLTYLVPSPLAGIVLVVCAVALVRGGRFRLRWLWLAILFDAGCWAFLVVAAYFEIQANIRTWVTHESAIHSWLTAVAYRGVALPATLVLLWYWWRPLWRRRRIDLRPGGAECIHCGYSLVGNVSGRCPECGQPTAVSD